MNILHVGLMVDGRNVGLARELKEQSEVYHELSTGERNLNQQILDVTEHRHFDAAFFQIQAANVVHPNTFRVLRERGIYTMNWSGDIRRTTESWFMETGADLTLFSNLRDIEFMRARGKNADFLQIGIDPEIFKKLDLPKSSEVVFMGNNYGAQFPLGAERLLIVNYVRSRGFQVYGSYQGATGNLNGNQVAENEVYNRTKIAINHSHFAVGRYTSDRMFRILGSGTFCLSHYYPGIEEDFEIGRDLEVYHSIDELDKKVKHYRYDDENRERIAANGYKLAHEKFTYKQMAAKIMDYARKS